MSRGCRTEDGTRSSVSAWQTLYHLSHVLSQLDPFLLFVSLSLHLFISPLLPPPLLFVSPSLSFLSGSSPTPVIVITVDDSTRVQDGWPLFALHLGLRCL